MPKSEIFVMTDSLRKTLENMPAANPRSRLEPFRSFILRWRREGRTYRNIQQILADKCGVSVTHRSVIQFVKLRSRPRKSQPEEEAMAVTPAVISQADVSLKRTKGGEDPYAEVRARMAKDKAKPVPPKPAKVFEYTDEDSIKPIVLLKPKKEN